MFQGWMIVVVSLLYLGVLFAIAWYGDKRSEWLSGWRPWIYSLSIAVYCTSQYIKISGAIRCNNN